MNEKKKYLKAVGAGLDCTRAMKSVFLGELADSMDERFGESESVTFETLAAEFGSPDEISSTFHDRADYAELLKKAKRRLKMWRVAAILAALLLCAAVVLIVTIVNETAGMVYVGDATKVVELGGGMG